MREGVDEVSDEKVIYWALKAAMWLMVVQSFLCVVGGIFKMYTGKPVVGLLVIFLMSPLVFTGAIVIRNHIKHFKEMFKERLRNETQA